MTQEPFQHVFMVTGYDEAIAAYHDQATFSNCNSAIGPFAKFPVPLEGDDITEIIETYRDELPFGDQLPASRPAQAHGPARLLMRLITPKRLKENEEFMVVLADRQIDTFHAAGECEYIGEYASPYTLLVIADLLGVPEEDQPQFLEKLMHKEHLSLEHSPLSYLWEQFTAYIEERRREPRDDVMTGLALATFPDGTLPPVEDVMKIASNLFAAGQETTARLLGSALKVIGERPELQQQLRDDRDLVPGFIEEMLRLESPIKGTFRLAKMPTTIAGTEIPAGSTVMVLPCRGQPGPPGVRGARRAAPRPGQRPPAHRLRPRHPHLRRRPAGPGRGGRLPPAALRPHRGHPDLRGPPRTAGRPALAVLADLDAPRAGRAAPRVHPGRVRASRWTRSAGADPVGRRRTADR